MMRRSTGAGYYIGHISCNLWRFKHVPRLQARRLRRERLIARIALEEVASGRCKGLTLLKELRRQTFFRRFDPSSFFDAWLRLAKTGCWAFASFSQGAEGWGQPRRSASRCGRCAESNLAEHAQNKGIGAINLLGTASWSAGSSTSGLLPQLRSVGIPTRKLPGFPRIGVVQAGPGSPDR